ncbi:MAG TPA: DUF86 domain-containing protein [Nitrospiraceae bacterium]|nr:MAG: hypothetical protein A2Z82_00065 [Nitrospirae bacterium GWA2_46_11]OGW23469.1 MAG: hypothetical protein A2X55_11215 [Nitrospirae bacterium GWB2_47_37]HAK88000.1 DUF86 domain-containing protein [Nitrospiraceae bacterium]HCZ11521.1 DUF86 domain-containing protein [Nitrospiraceae bacterium]
MTEQIRIKIEKIMEYKKILHNMKEDCVNNFFKDPVYRGAVLHYLYLIADSCISLAEMIIRDKEFRTPQSYHEAVDILGENKIIPPDFAYEFANIASFRNLLAHDYEKIDYLKICGEALGKLDDISRYVDYIKENY